MHSLRFVPALLAVVSAVPQGVNFGKIDEELPPIETFVPVTAPPTIIHFDPEAELAKIVENPTKAPIINIGTPVGKRDLDNSGCSVCEPQPTIANYYNVDVSTDAAFLADTNIAAVASGAITPAGYTQVYNNLQAGSNGYVYMGYEVLSAAVEPYDPAACAAKCDTIAGCQAFNIFFERNPTYDACSSSCQDPAAFANIKCTYFGGPLIAASAQNTGQWRNHFHVVLAGSNAYVNTTVPVNAGYDGIYLGTASINAPNDCNGQDTYLGFKLFENTPFDIRLCAAACTAQTAYNLAYPPATGPVKVCNFWNTYLLDKNGISQGQLCSLYTETWNSSYATNFGQWTGNDHYTIQASYIGGNSSFASSC